jgi:hypothetical protein
MIERMLHNWISNETNVPTRESFSSDLLPLDNRINRVKSVGGIEWERARRGIVSSVFGAQIIKLKMHSILSPVTTSVGGILTSVLGMAYNGFANQSALAAAFDEVRFTTSRNKFIYYPQLVAAGSNSNLLAVAVLDYDDSSPLSSTNNALQYDTARMVNMGCVPRSANAEESSVKWEVDLMGQPDLVWASTQNYTSGVAYLKFYNVSSLASSTTFGYVMYVCEMEFRQAN